MNNKGQSLVLFVLIIPILLGIIVLVVDVGRVILVKNEINNKIQLVIENSLEDNLEIDKVEELVSYNLDEYSNEVSYLDGAISVKSSGYVDGVISNVLGFSGFSVESWYRGYIKNNKNIIEKVK